MKFSTIVIPFILNKELKFGYKFARV